ncbi:hypothetical protein PHLGIDRAFT_117320 [Phlebiopsis gigantea 11061_1 CR5-6]|uniref:Uncharacterized protein n=1 Tax=Phlebiopsis gigantea (strain 11061_1 CR5-6) TaxID=745531 RepID=A0A0C3S9J1_PHLG1|nr:hypothetical protein PHLGIDRAFT_117320 [Phlebiopsis gigantea 11061_1 CR5-6]
MEVRMKEALSKTFQSILEVEIELERVMTEQPEGEDCPKPPFHWVPEDVFLEYVLDLPIVVLMNKYAQVWLDIHKTAKTRHDWVRLVREWKHNRLSLHLC